MISRTVSGEPIAIGDRDVVPVVRVVGLAPERRGRGAGVGAGMLRAVPVAVIERRGRGERRIPIPDATGQTIRGMAVAGVALWVVLWILRWRWSHGR